LEVKPLRATVELCLSKLWGRHWNAIARAEFRRHFGIKTVSVVVMLALLAYAGVAASLILFRRFSMASGVTRAILGFTWLITMVWVTTTVQKAMVLDRKLGVIEQWLLTPMSRKDLLVSRLAGMSAVAPVFIILLFPLYVVGAAGLSGAQYGLFAIGHVARFFSAAPPRFPEASFNGLIALPVALLAVLCDVSICALAGYAALVSALQGVSWKRLFRDSARAITQLIQLTLWSLSMGMVLLAVEVACGAAAGFYCYYAWERTGSRETLMGLGVAAGVSLLAVTVRGLMTGPHAGVAGRYHDAVLLEDDPGTRRD
jgi:hypothetical protein